MGHTLILEVPEDLYKLLAKTAEQIGQSHETLAIEWLAVASRHLTRDPLEKFIGAFSSNSSDWADHHDQYIGMSLMETMHNAERRSSDDV